jgi:hypothetical protein
MLLKHSEIFKKRTKRFMPIAPLISNTMSCIVNLCIDDIDMFGMLDFFCLLTPCDLLSLFLFTYRIKFILS